jgi:hypothetical protein
VRGRRVDNLNNVIWVASGLALLGMSACTSKVPVGPTTQGKSPEGFWERVADQITARECNVGRFTCPSGFGSAGEFCECTDPRGVVRHGVTIKGDDF